jgi:hypothetical protein
MFRERILAVLAKIEGTSGTDSVPTGAANAVNVVGIPTLKFGFLEDGNRTDAQFGGLGAADSAGAAGRYGQVDITLELRGFGAAYSSPNKPPADVFWRMAGFVSTTSFTGGAEFYRYKSLDSGMETATLYLYTANKLFKLVGCVAQPKLTAEANKRGLVTFTVTGRIASDPTETAIPALTFNATIPPLFNASPTAIGAWNESSSDPLVLRKASLDFGTAIAERPSAGATDGLAGYVITDRMVRQMMTVEVPALSTFDAFAAAKASSATGPVTSWQVGTAQYNRVKIVTGRWALEAPGDGSDRGIKTHDLTGLLVQGTESVDSRELTIKYD